MKTRVDQNCYTGSITEADIKYMSKRQFRKPLPEPVDYTGFDERDDAGISGESLLVGLIFLLGFWVGVLSAVLVFT